MNNHNDIVDRRMKDYYEQYSLDVDRLRALRTVASAQERPPLTNGQSRGATAQGRNQSPARRSRTHLAPLASSWRTNVAVAAAVVVVVAGVFVMLQMRRSPESTAVGSEQAAAEIALNHGKQLAVEFPAASFTRLAEAMPKLGFAPRRPRQLPKSDYALVGARYCKIGGSIAVQARLTHDGRAYTLYQWRDDPAFALMRESSIDVDGVRVVLWREGGLIMGLADPEP